jgi:cysteinyl-tRNA synthetase
MSADRPDPIAQPTTPSSDLASKPDQPRASDAEQDEEERRRAGRGGGGINPGNASHSLNIRPDVVEGPAGLEVRTTMKSAHYRAEASLEADLTEAARDTREEHQEPLREQVAQRDAATHDDAQPRPGDDLETDLLDAANDDDGDPQREQAYRQASEESTKRQDAERAARSGEDMPGDAASTATDSLAADLRAAEKAAKLEREGDGQDEASRDQADTGQAASKGGGRGLFLG